RLGQYLRRLTQSRRVGACLTAPDNPLSAVAITARSRFAFPSASRIRRRVARSRSSSAKSVSADAPECIRLRGVHQNNLKGFDLDLPLGKYIVVTGLSGAGKSSLVFDTLHAEGQRRYVETFSAYTRQFLDLLDKPKVDSIENIRPSIAIEQTNTVKTSRSTVGTMTELTDYFKVWFSHVAACFDPDTGLSVEDDTPASIWAKTTAAQSGRTVVITFRVARPDNLTWPEILTNLKGQGYARVLLPAGARPTPNAQRPTPNQPDPSPLVAHRIDDLLAAAEDSDLGHWMLGVGRWALDVGRSAQHLYVAQDRLPVQPAQKSRFLEAAEAAFHFGQGARHPCAGADLSHA